MDGKAASLAGFARLQIGFANGWLCVAATTLRLPIYTIEREGGV
jgi:hypothetical protein